MEHRFCLDEILGKVSEMINDGYHYGSIDVLEDSLLDNGQSIDIRPPANGLFWIGSFQKNQDPRPPGPLLDELFSFGNFSDTLQEIGLCFEFF